MGGGETQEDHRAGVTFHGQRSPLKVRQHGVVNLGVECDCLALGLAGPGIPNMRRFPRKTTALGELPRSPQALATGDPGY